LFPLFLVKLSKVAMGISQLVWWIVTVAYGILQWILKTNGGCLMFWINDFKQINKRGMFFSDDK